MSSKIRILPRQPEGTIRALKGDKYIILNNPDSVVAIVIPAAEGSPSHILTTHKLTKSTSDRYDFDSNREMLREAYNLSSARFKSGVQWYPTWREFIMDSSYVNLLTGNFSTPEQCYVLDSTLTWTITDQENTPPPLVVAPIQAHADPEEYMRRLMDS